MSGVEQEVLLSTAVSSSGVDAGNGVEQEAMLSSGVEQTVVLSR